MRKMWTWAIAEMCGGLLAFSAAFGADAGTIAVTSGATVAAFSDRNGALLSFKSADGVERVKPADELFTLQFLDKAGNATDMKSSDFRFRREGDSFVYEREAGPEVRIRIRGDGDTLLFRPTVSRWPKGFRLNWIDAPQVVVANDGALYWPFYDGCEVTKFDNRENPFSWSDYRPVGWTPRCKAWGSLYPGSAQMQFLAYYRGGRGVYFAAHDDRHVPKAVEYDWLDGERTRLSLQTFCGDAKDGVYESPFEYRLKPYEGEWMEACELYRDWVRTLPAFAKQPDRPAWAAASPVNLIYAVKGDGIDHGPNELPPNRYYPYTNVLAEVERYGRLFDAKIMTLLMHWEGTAPWCPPYVWPPYGGEAALAALRDALHAKGNLLGLYCSGTAWTQASCIDPRYTQSAKFADENLGRWMMRGPKGEIDATICNHPRAQRYGYDMCLTETWSRRTAIDEALKIARFGVDYCQYFDQNIGGGVLLCWSGAHRHPPVPGSWATRAMLSLQDDFIAEVRAAGSKMTIGCEGCAATPYVGNLFYNDARTGNDIAFGRPVPGVPFVFHEWMCNFSGNQIGHETDAAFRWTRSFHCGDMMSVILGPDGKLVNAWAVKWNRPLPNQDVLISLVRNFTALRRRYPQFLLKGRMIRPFKAVASEDDVFTSFWQSADGDRLGFVSNWKGVPVNVTCAGERLRLGPYETRELRP